MAVKLTCSVCKFSLTPATAEESATYEANRPMHCAQPMVFDGEKPVTTPAETPAAKEEKKGLFGFGGKSKKKK